MCAPAVSSVGSTVILLLFAFVSMLRNLFLFYLVFLLDVCMCPPLMYYQQTMPYLSMDIALSSILLLLKRMRQLSTETYITCLARDVSRCCCKAAKVQPLGPAAPRSFSFGLCDMTATVYSETFFFLTFEATLFNGICVAEPFLVLLAPALAWWRRVVRALY